MNSEGKSVNVSSLNILDKNVCFLADNFEDNKNLVNCGFAHLNITSKGKNFNITTCFFVPDQISDDLLLLFSNSYKSLLDLYVIDFAELNDEGVLKIKTKIKKLLYNVDYEIIVEDEYEKKVKYSNSNKLVQIINDDKETDSNIDTVSDEDTEEYSDIDIDQNTEVIEIVKPTCGAYLSKINIFMALFLVPLLL